MNIKFKKRRIATLMACVAMGILPEGQVVMAQDSKTEDSEFSYTNINVSNEGKVLLLQIDVPSRNEVSRRILKDINAGLDAALEDDSIGAVVITGSNGSFSQGAGGEAFSQDIEKVRKKGYARTQAALARRVYRRIEGFPKPVIAAINGVSTNGGNELAMSCDIRIAGKSASFGQRELLAGVIPGFGGIQRLQRHVGRARAMEIIMTGRMVDAEEALSIGLVTSVVDDDKVVSEALALGELITENADSNALSIFKQRISESYDETFSQALTNDQITFDELAPSYEAQVALQRYIERQSQ